jgi:hypothetical protein
MTKGMKGYFFFDIGLFKCLPHYPVKTFAAVSAIGVLTIKKPDVRFFHSEICLKTFGHILRERYNAIFLVFALSDMNGFSFKVNIGYFHVAGFLGTQSSGIN